MKLYRTHLDISNRQHYYVFTDIKVNKKLSGTFTYYLQFENISGILHSNVRMYWASAAGINKWLQENKYETMPNIST